MPYANDGKRKKETGNSYHQTVAHGLSPLSWVWSNYLNALFCLAGTEGSNAGLHSKIVGVCICPSECNKKRKGH